MNRIPRPFEVYRHFKGNYYQILTVAEHSETGEQMVVYQQLYSPFRTYVRPLAMFCSEVDRKKYPKADQTYRFELQTELRNAQEDGLYPAYKKSPAVEPVKNIGATEEKHVEAQNVVDEDLQLHPLLVEFLDADSYERKLEILSNMHRVITDDMINTISVSLDLEVKEGDIESRYKEVQNCLITLEKFECNRLR